MLSKAVSVICITHKKGEALRNTLSSLLPQIQTGDEVIIIDDGSHDKNIVGKAHRRFSHSIIRYICVEHRGYRLSLMRNLGIQLAEHDWLIGLDADCCPQDGWMVCYKRNFEDGVFLFGRIEWQRENGLQRDSRFDYTAEQAKPELFKGNLPPWPMRTWGGNWACSSSDISDIRFFSEEYHNKSHEEADLGNKIFYANKQVKFLFDAWTIHQYHRVTRPHEGNELLEQRKVQYASGNLSSTWTRLEDCPDWEEIPL